MTPLVSHAAVAEAAVVGYPDAVMGERVCAVVVPQTGQTLTEEDARAIAAEPEVLLLDEPCSALDPIATGRIEDLIEELKGSYSVLMVTHNMQQASRASDYCAFMYLGRLVEYGATTDIFLSPRLRETEDYVTGRFG